MYMIFLTVLLFVSLSLLEKRYAFLKDPPSETKASYATNIKLFLLNDVFLSFFSIGALFFIAEKFSGLGLLSYFPAGWLKHVVAFALLDFLLYLWHRMDHTFLFLWSFHQIHHSDRCFNVSTALRFHIGALVLSVLPKSIGIILLGIPAWDIVWYEGLISLFVILQHSNLKFPAESVLARIFVVPALHRVHHSTHLKQRDKNFGIVFSFWDQLFGTYSCEPAKGIGLSHIEQMSVAGLIKLGFSDAASSFKSAFSSLRPSC